MSSEPPRTVWLGLLAPPLAWFAALTAGYFMVAWACGSVVGAVTLHGVLLLMLLLAAAGGLLAVRSWRRSGDDWPGASPDPRTSTRFLSVVATFGGVLFSLAILLFWVAVVTLDPCEPGPRLRFAPSALVEDVGASPRGGTALAVSNDVGSPSAARPETQSGDARTDAAAPLFFRGMPTEIAGNHAEPEGTRWDDYDTFQKRRTRVSARIATT